MGNSQNQENKQRPPFKLFELNPMDPPPKCTLKILSFNLLADCYLTKFPYKMITYYVDKAFKQLDYRTQKISEIVEELNADIMGFQEIDDKNEKLFEILGEQEYTYVKQQKKQFGKDFAAIAWKKNRFELMDTESWVGTDKILPKYLTYSEYQKSWGVMLFVKLLDKVSGKEFLIVNGHYYFYAMLTKKHVQCSEMAQILQAIYKRVTNGNENIIILGDFNANPTSISLQFLKMHHQDQFYKALEKSDKSLYSKLDEYQNYFFPQIQEKSIHLENAYEDYVEKFHKPAYTIYKKFYTSTLDYIFYNKKGNIQPYKCLDKPTLDELKQFGGFLPNQFYPSDHIPLLIEFAIEN